MFDFKFDTENLYEGNFPCKVLPARTTVPLGRIRLAAPASTTLPPATPGSHRYREWSCFCALWLLEFRNFWQSLWFQRPASRRLLRRVSWRSARFRPDALRATTPPPDREIGSSLRNLQWKDWSVDQGIFLRFEKIFRRESSSRIERTCPCVQPPLTSHRSASTFSVLIQLQLVVIKFHLERFQFILYKRKVRFQKISKWIISHYKIYHTRRGSSLKEKWKVALNQSINQSTKEPTNQSTKEPTNQSINQSVESSIYFTGKSSFLGLSPEFVQLFVLKNQI